MGDSGRIVASGCRLRAAVLLLLLSPPLLVLLLAAVLLPELLVPEPPPPLPPLPPPVRSPGRCVGGADALAAAAAAKPVVLLAGLRAALAARSAAAAASAGEAAAGELNSASPTSSQRMVRAVALEATACPMLSGKRSASARSSADSVCTGRGEQLKEEEPLLYGQKAVCTKTHWLAACRRDTAHIIQSTPEASSTCATPLQLQTPKKCSATPRPSPPPPPQSTTGCQRPSAAT